MLRSKEDAVFQFCVNAFLWFIALIMILPLWRVFMLALTPFGYRDKTFGLFVNPSVWTIEAYTQFFSHPSFFFAFRNSLIITVGGTAINLLLTIPMSYALSYRPLPGRKALNVIVLIPFLFNAGLIPTYLVVTGIGLHNTLWAVMIPGAISIFNMFIMRNFFMEIPSDFMESARIDGAGEMFILWRIVLPLSMPIILTIGLFYAVGHWNEFFAPMLYLNDAELQPLPILLRNILMASNMNDYMDYQAFAKIGIQSLKSASVFITMLPMMMVYPWIQKYFVKGTLVGGLKG